ncbi:MAG TPA: ribosome assembly protein 4 [Nostocaceae cyanobacterium]|nr:ribosome assembly protein 4 [Nostocaceae cyanobacterium]
MTNTKPPEPEKSLQKLAWALESSAGEFKLILAKCNYVHWRNKLIQQLQQICQLEISTLHLSSSVENLYTTIQAQNIDTIQALMVVGLENHTHLHQILTKANQIRELFRNNFHFPIVLWINDEIYKQIMQVSPDLESWTTTRNFPIPHNELVNYINQLAEQYFNHTLNLTFPEFPILETELEAAKQELHHDSENFNLELQVNLLSLLAFIQQQNNKIDSAITTHQQALATCQQLNNLNTKIKIIGEITSCYYQNSDWENTRKYTQAYINLILQVQNPELIANSIKFIGQILADLQEWEQLKNLVEQALKIHHSQNQLPELARDYGFLAEIALAQENWLEARKLAQQAIDTLSVKPLDNLTKEFNDNLYHFILAKAQYHLGEIPAAITNLEKIVNSQNLNYKFYLEVLVFLRQLYKEQKEHLKAYDTKQQQRAIERQYGLIAFIGAGWLQPTKQFIENTPAKSPAENVAPEIAASGRQLDVERLIERVGRNDYKLIVIHGQSGVGKSSLVNAGLIPALKNKAIGIQDNLPVAVRTYTNWVQELGQSMVEALQERENRRELKQQVSTLKVETSTLKVETSTLKVETSTLKVETSTLKVETPTLKLDTPTLKVETPTLKLDTPTLKLDTPSLEVETSTPKVETSTPKVETSTLKVETSTPEVETHHSPASLVAQLRENEQHHLRTVLIFDQFEEFFFVYTAPQQRREFFEFLGKCLNVLSAKVILSLRVDYLHYLLECNELPSLKIIGNDILSQNVLYKLGNFSPDDTKAIIQRLTENTSFKLEPTLIDQLVQDLAADLGEVRPIELQIVGAQLQTENITALAVYQQSGTKQELVKRYLDEVIHDCGEENQLLAEFLLYSLTDEKGTRPLKTKAELERDLQLLAADIIKDDSKLDLVLEIVVKSGLVVLLPEKPGDRYQLVHDYLAAFIRQQQDPKLQRIMAELEEQRRNAKISEINNFIKFSTTFIAFEKTKDAIVEALKAVKRLEKLEKAPEDIQTKVITTLREAVYFQPKQHLLEELNTLSGHSSSVYSVAFSPNGKQLASGSADNSIKIWDIATGQQLQTLSGHSSLVYSVAFSPDGKKLVSGSGDKRIKIWNTTTGKQLQTLSGHFSLVYSVAFSPDGKKLVSGSKDNSIKIWNVATGQQLQTLSSHSVLSVSFSPDGKKLASGSEDKSIKIWDTTTGKQLQTLNGHGSSVLSISFSPNGKKLAFGSADSNIKIWDINAGKALQTLSGHSSSVQSITFSPNGTKLASGSWDKSIKIWDTTTGKKLQTLSGHSSIVFSVSFSPDGKKLASGSFDKSIKIWDTATGQQLQTLSDHSNFVFSVSFSPDGKKLASGSFDKSIKIWDTTTGKLLQTLSNHSSFVLSVAFSPDGKKLASGSADNSIKIWDIISGQQLQTLSGHISQVTRVVFSPDGKKLASGSADNSIKIWDTATGKLLQTLSGHSDSVLSVTFSPDGKKLASGSADNSIKIWDTATGKLLQTLNGHSSLVTSVVFSPDGTKLASCSGDKTIILWDLNLQSLVKDACNLLNDYLIVNPDVLAELEDCQTPKRLQQAATVLVIQGEQLARNKDIDNAVVKFRQAKGWDNSLNFDPQGKAEELAK